MKRKILVPTLVGVVTLSLIGGTAFASNNGLLPEWNSNIVSSTSAEAEEIVASEANPENNQDVEVRTETEEHQENNVTVRDEDSTERSDSATSPEADSSDVPSVSINRPVTSAPEGRPLTAQPAPVNPPASPSPSPPAAPAPPPPPAPAPPAAPACPANVGGSVPGFSQKTSPLGVAGTTVDDLQSFATKYNQIRVANCLPPVPMNNFRYDSCMEQRLFWMAEDPSTDPMSAWGHIGSQRSDGVPSVGCDGNLAGGSGNTGATVAQKWWDSSGHRASLYKPSHTGSTANVCILLAVTHGGVPNEPYSFTRAAARWVNC